MSNDFTLEDFILPTDNDVEDITIPVCIPVQPFHIHPSMQRRVSPLWLARPDGKWWLVHPEVVARYHVPKLWKADLYQAIWPDGRSFLLPVTHPRASGPEGWYSSLTEAVQEAQQGWITLERDHNSECYDFERPKGWRKAPNWPDWDFEDIVHLAFFDHLLTVPTAKAMQLTRRRTPRRFIEETVE